MVDRVKPLKMESPSSGGTETDDFPTSLDSNEDHIDVRGLVFQNDVSNDEAVSITRTNSELIFKDSTAGTKTLNDLASASGVTVAQHKALRDLIHFIDEGPADGFPSGSYKETLPAANPFPTGVIWWESSSKLKKIVELTITRNANKTPSIEEWKLYDTDGSTVLLTLTDTIAYSGVFETTRTRTWV